MKIDWQKYDSGELSPEETRIADEALRTDESARKELEGLRSFRNMVRGAALSEPVPHNRLRQILKQVVGKRETYVWRRSATLVTIAAGAAALAFIAYSLINNDNDQLGEEERRSFNDELVARTWAVEKSGVELPSLQLASLGKFDSVHCGVGWACFDYIVDEQIVHVYIKKNNRRKMCEIVQKGDQTFYVSDVISFEEQGLTVSVMGADEEVRWKVIDYTNKEPDAVY